VRTLLVALALLAFLAGAACDDTPVVILDPRVVGDASLEAGPPRSS
jgi:hypothetical protein